MLLCPAVYYIYSTAYSHSDLPTAGGILGPQVLRGLVRLSREISVSRQVLRNMPGPGDTRDSTQSYLDIPPSIPLAQNKYEFIPDYQYVFHQLMNNIQTLSFLREGK